MRRVFRLPSSRKRISDELDAELRFHLDGRVEDLMEHEGLSREAAEREARRRFGNYEAYRQEAHAIDDSMVQRRNVMALLESVARETKTAGRALRRSPGFTIISILTLALGLGAATTIFTLLDRVVLRPLPYPNADRLVHLATAWPKVKAGTEYGISRGQYFYFKQYSALLEDVFFYDVATAMLAGDKVHAPERVSAIATSANAFKILDIKPIAGRPFTTEDELNAGRPRLGLISYEFWQRRFGGDVRVIGRYLEIDDATRIEILGVLPPGATMPDGSGDVWFPNHLDPNDPPQNNHTHYGVALRKPGVTVASVHTELQQLQNRIQTEYPRTYGASFLARTGFSMRATSLRDHVVGATIVRALWLVFAAVGFVLLIAGANVANLFLIRLDARRREVALRRALGADALHIAINTLTESISLAVVAAVLAMALGSALLKFVLVIAPQSLPRLTAISFDWRSGAFCVALAVLFGVVFGLIPLTSSNNDAGVLRDGSRGTTRSKTRDALRRGLVIAEVALAVVLLAGAGLMVKSFARLRGIQPGFDASGVQTMQILTPPSLNSPEAVATFWRTLTTRLEALPGVIHAGAASQLPLDGSGDGCSGLSVDVTNAAGEGGNCMPSHVATPGFFEAMGIHVRGKLPTWDEVQAGVGPAVITKGFGDRFWEKADPIGHWAKPYSPQHPQFPIVAVTNDEVHFSGLQSPPSQWIYFPLIAPKSAARWNEASALTLVVKAPSLSTSAVVSQVRAILSQIEPKAVVADETPMEKIVACSMAQTSFTMLLLIISAIIAVLLSAIGLYGVVSYVVTQRRGEIGVRRALGAQVGDVTRLVVGQSVALAGIGALVGIVAAIAGTRVLQSLLFDVSPTDPLVLGGTVVMLLMIAVVAAAAPARRAARIDPVEAMRAASS